MAIEIVDLPINSWFTHWKWWFSSSLCYYVSLPEGIQKAQCPDACLFGDVAAVLTSGCTYGEFVVTSNAQASERN